MGIALIIYSAIYSRRIGVDVHSDINQPIQPEGLPWKFLLQLLHLMCCVEKVPETSISFFLHEVEIPNRGLKRQIRALLGKN